MITAKIRKTGEIVRFKEMPRQKKEKPVYKRVDPHGPYYWEDELEILYCDISEDNVEKITESKVDPVYKVGDVLFGGVTYRNFIKILDVLQEKGKYLVYDYCKGKENEIDFNEQSFYDIHNNEKIDFEIGQYLHERIKDYFENVYNIKTYFEKEKNVIEPLFQREDIIVDELDDSEVYKIINVNTEYGYYYCYSFLDRECEPIAFNHQNHFRKINLNKTVL